MENVTNCPLCGAGDFKKKFSSKDFSLTRKEFTVVECQDCHLLFTNPRPGQASIGDYYKSPSYISHTNQSFGFFGKLYQAARKRALELKLTWIKKHIELPGKLLDYGSGTGEFLNLARSKGWAVQGIEIADEPRRASKSKYNLEVQSPSALGNIEDQSLDVITMWHVLEHVADLSSVMEGVISKLKKNGMLVLALPNPDSWDANHYKEYWAAWDLPIHFYHFKKKNIEFLASRFGLELVEIRNMPFDSYYVSLLSEGYVGGNFKWIKAAFIGFVSNVRSGGHNASSLTYILRKSKTGA